MLRSPYTRYERLFVYYFDHKNLPVIDDPDHIGTWIEDETALLFFHRSKKRLVNDICAACNAKIIYEADLDYQDWEAGVKIENFSTDFLHIYPIWEPGPAGKSTRQSILLDPSVIFGSGFHASTRLCLETLERLTAHYPAAIKSVLDLGTGTGLLAIAAAKLGAKRITAVDNNPLSCKVATHNVALNKVTQEVQIIECDLTKKLPDTTCDLVIANLYKGLLIQLLEQDSFWQGRFYILSGFIPSMEAELLAALPPKNIRVLARYNRENWRLWLIENTRTHSNISV